MHSEGKSIYCDVSNNKTNYPCHLTIFSLNCWERIDHRNNGKRTYFLYQVQEFDPVLILLWPWICYLNSKSLISFLHIMWLIINTYILYVYLLWKYYPQSLLAMPFIFFLLVRIWNIRLVDHIFLCSWCNFVYLDWFWYFWRKNWSHQWITCRKSMFGLKSQSIPFILHVSKQSEKVNSLSKIKPQE